MFAPDRADNRNTPDYFDLYKLIQDLPPTVRSAVSQILVRYCEMRCLRTIDFEIDARKREAKAREALRQTAVAKQGLVAEDASAVEIAQILCRPDLLLHLRVRVFVARLFAALKQGLRST